MITFIKTTLADLWQFIKRPNDEQINLTFTQKLQFFTILFSTEILFTLIVVFPLGDVIGLILPSQDTGSLFLLEDDTLVKFFIAFVISPAITEELIFRFFLRYRTMYHRLFTKRSWDRFFPYLVYCSAMLFGAIHITNSDTTSIWLYILAPLIVLSQAIGGLVIAFIRVRLNFIWGVIYHVLWNFVFIIPLFMFSSYDEYVQNNDDYSLEVQPQAFYESDKHQGIKIAETTDGKITSLEVDQHTLNFVIQQVYGEGKYYSNEDIFVNIQLDSEKGISKQELLQVLQEEYYITELQDTGD